MATAAKKTAPAAKTPPPAAKKAAANAVAVKPKNEVVAHGGDFSAMAGQGMQGMTKDDLAIPFLVILQGNSPQVKRSDGAYIEGAAEGMLFNTVTKEVIDPDATTVLLTACAYSRAFVEWKVREAGGGFVREHSVPNGLELLATCVKDDKNRDILESGNQLNDTRTFYVVLMDEGGSPSPAIISMTSTQIKKAKQWNQQMNMLKLKNAEGRTYTPPMFASQWLVKTVPESNEKGSWMGWAFEHAGYFESATDPGFVFCYDFSKSVAQGAVKADHARAAEAGASGPAGGDDEIPF